MIFILSLVLLRINHNTQQGCSRCRERAVVWHPLWAGAEGCTRNPPWGAASRAQDPYAGAVREDPAGALWPEALSEQWRVQCGLRNKRSSVSWVAPKPSLSPTPFLQDATRQGRKKEQEIYFPWVILPHESCSPACFGIRGRQPGRWCLGRGAHPCMSPCPEERTGVRTVGVAGMGEGLWDTGYSSILGRGRVRPQKHLENGHRCCIGKAGSLLMPDSCVSLGGDEVPRSPTAWEVKKCVSKEGMDRKLLLWAPVSPSVNQKAGPEESLLKGLPHMRPSPSPHPCSLGPYRDLPSLHPCSRTPQISQALGGLPLWAQRILKPSVLVPCFPAEGKGCIFEHFSPLAHCPALQMGTDWLAFTVPTL